MTPAGLARLKLDEGLKLKAYPDPETGKEPWTIGYGCTGERITKDTVWTKEQADSALIGRLTVISTYLGRTISGWSNLTPVQQDVLINIAYNIGIPGLMKWTRTLADIANRDYKAVVQEIRSNNVWRHDVHERVTRCADAFETSTW